MVLNQLNNFHFFTHHLLRLLLYIQTIQTPKLGRIGLAYIYIRAKKSTKERQQLQEKN